MIIVKAHNDEKYGEQPATHLDYIKKFENFNLTFSSPWGTEG